MDSASPDGLLQLVFRGEVLPGHEPAAVRSAVAGALKLDAARAERLFSGKRVVVRRAVDAAKARRYVALFAVMGAVLHTEPARPRPAPSRPARRPAARRTTGKRWRLAAWWQPLQWVAIGALCVIGGALLGLLLGPGVDLPWLSAQPPAATAPARADATAPLRAAPAPALPPTTTAAPPQPDPEMPPDMSVDALRDYRDRYLRAAAHRAFAIAPSGAFAWHAGATSENAARELALSGCMAAARGGEGCRVVHVDAQWQE